MPTPFYTSSISNYMSVYAQGSNKTVAKVLLLIKYMEKYKTKFEQAQETKVLMYILYTCL